MRIAMVFLLLMVAASPVTAAEQNVYNRINLSASASMRVGNDIMAATLMAQAEGKDAAKLAEKVNREVQWGTGILDKHPDLKYSSLDYRSQPIYEKSHAVGWRISQSIRVESRDAAQLSEVLGQLQHRLRLTNISFSVSPQRRQENENRLIVEAIDAFETRASIIAKAMGKKGYRVVRLSISGNGSGPPVMMRAMQMDAMAAPVVKSGESSLAMSVNGEIELK